MKKPIWKITAAALFAAVVCFTAYFLISGYINGLPKIQYDMYGGAVSPSYPDVSFAVMSDLHFYDASLGTSGAAFEEVLYSDRKLLVESEELLDFAISGLLESDARFVLVSGDLTKDGELINHRRMAQKLQVLTDNGIKVCVVPGNHDVNNHNAVRFEGGGAYPVENVSAAEFAEIYAGAGYGDAVSRHGDSLSYVSEPVPGLWILAIDACRYNENSPDGVGSVIPGRVSQELADWMSGVLKDSVAQNKAVIALMHHGAVEHWEGQAKLHPNYIVEDHKYFGEFLASYGVRMVFTGHYHAQSVVRSDFGDKFIYDAETGSLLTYPCPIRYCGISGNTFTAASDMLGVKLRPGTDFAQNAKAFVKQTVMFEALDTLYKYKVSQKDAEYIADAVGDAFAAHYDGDADTAARPAFDAGRLGLWGRIVYQMQKYVLDGLWNDLPPADNDVSFSLS
ncbi:MAG: metallophosphoesterase [Oscillospiraceae bacterium]|nr:metallophosphoesterase [Oscillospiraceae bacterium]